MTFLGVLSRDFGFDVQVGCFQTSLREKVKRQQDAKSYALQDSFVYSSLGLLLVLCYGEIMRIVYFIYCTS